MSPKNSNNPVVQSIIAGKAPPTARMAAARGLLPLPQADLLEVLVFLRGSDEADLAKAAQATLDSQEPNDLLTVAKSDETAPSVLGYLAALPNPAGEIEEAIAGNQNTPDEAIALLARISKRGALLESITLNQQRLIAAPEIIDAILLNPARTAEAERRATSMESTGMLSMAMSFMVRVLSGVWRGCSSVQTRVTQHARATWGNAGMPS